MLGHVPRMSTLLGRMAWAEIKGKETINEWGWEARKSVDDNNEGEKWMVALAGVCVPRRLQYGILQENPVLSGFWFSHWRASQDVGGREMWVLIPQVVSGWQGSRRSPKVQGNQFCMSLSFWVLITTSPASLEATIVTSSQVLLYSLHPTCAFVNDSFLKPLSFSTLSVPSVPSWDSDWYHDRIWCCENGVLQEKKEA